MKSVSHSCYLRFTLLILFALLALSVTNSVSAREQIEDIASDEDIVEEVLLIRLVYIDIEQLAREEVEIPIAAGNFESPQNGVRTDKIIILPGSTVAARYQPADRQIQLYRGISDERKLLGTLHIRYYPEPNNAWVPHFKLHQKITLVPKGKGWQAITLSGVAEPFLLSGGALPNAEGFYPQLEIGFGGKGFYLDSWLIK